MRMSLYTADEPQEIYYGPQERGAEYVLTGATGSFEIKNCNGYLDRFDMEIHAASAMDISVTNEFGEIVYAKTGLATAKYSKRPRVLQQLNTTGADLTTHTRHLCMLNQTLTVSIANATAGDAIGIVASFWPN